VRSVVQSTQAHRWLRGAVLTHAQWAACLGLMTPKVPAFLPTVARRSDGTRARHPCVSLSC
jgi:hypothetical protein